MDFSKPREQQNKPNRPETKNTGNRIKPIKMTDAVILALITGTVTIITTTVNLILTNNASKKIDNAKKEIKEIIKHPEDLDNSKKRTNLAD